MSPRLTTRNIVMVAGLFAAAALPAIAADPGISGPPSATLTLSAKAAAVGVGYSWGDGTLIYHGERHKFSVKGISIADVGYAEVVGHGRVYHLEKLADFSGNYAAATGEATIVNGIGGQILRNANGVEIRVDEITKGARLAGSANGIQLTLSN